MRWTALRAQVRAELVLTLRRGESVLVTIGIPAGVLVFFATVKLVDTGFRHDVDFLLPGVLALGVMSTAMVSLGIATGFERRYLVLKRLGATPLGRPTLIGAKILAVLCIELVQVALLVAVATLLGWDQWAALPAAIPLVLLGSLAFGGIGLAMAGMLRAELTLALANAVYLVLLLVGDMAVPLDRLPRPVAAVAELLPAAALARGLRGVLAPGESVALGAMLVLGVWAVVAPAVAAKTFRWEE